MIPDQSKYQELLARARKRYRQAVDAERRIRDEFQIDMKFISGDQWDEKIRTERERGPSPRPCLVFNKVLPPVTQLGNQARQNKPAIQVNPVDSAGDIDTAKVYAGIIRHIEYESDADQAYDTALFYAAAGGFGYWMYTSEYEPGSFDQSLRVVTIDDPLSVYLDCYAQKPDRSDMKWAFREFKMPKDAFEARFGEYATGLTLDLENELEGDGWREDDAVRVAEYWEVETEEKTLREVREPDGTARKVYVEDLDDWSEEDFDNADWITDEDGEIRERKEEIPRVMQYIINGAQVLEAPTRWEGATVPIVIVTGLEVVVRGERKIFSMTRFARDPQQLLNFYKTMEAETASLAPKPKWVGAVGQFKTKRRDWQRANTDNAAYLEYDPVAVGDKLAPEPQWRTFDPPTQMLAIGAAAANDDIKSATGYFDPSLGAAKYDQSGIAIKSLQRQGDVSNFHFLDNLARSIKRGGRILIEMIPRKYDTEREIRIIGEDQKQRVIKVNSPGVGQDGKPYHYSLDRGKYDLTAQQGPSYPTQRLEAFQQLTELAQGNPKLMDIGGDVILANSDIIGADILAKRWRMTLPPQMQNDGDDQGNIPPQFQAQLSQMQQQMQGLIQQNQQMAQLLKSRMLETQAKVASGERIAVAKIESAERIATQGNQAKVETALATSRNATLNKLAELDHDRVENALDRRSDLLHAQLSVEADIAGDAADRQHDQAMQAGEQQHDAALQFAGQQHDQNMQAADQAHALELQQQQAALQPPPVQPPNQPGQGSQPGQ